MFSRVKTKVLAAGASDEEFSGASDEGFSSDEGFADVSDGRGASGGIAGFSGADAQAHSNRQSNPGSSPYSNRFIIIPPGRT